MSDLIDRRELRAAAELLQAASWTKGQATFDPTTVSKVDLLALIDSAPRADVDGLVALRSKIEALDAYSPTYSRDGAPMRVDEFGSFYSRLEVRALIDAAPEARADVDGLVAPGIEYDRGLHDGYRQCADIDAPRLEALRLLVQWADDVTHNVPPVLRAELREAAALLAALSETPTPTSTREEPA